MTTIEVRHIFDPAQPSHITSVWSGEVNGTPIESTQYVEVSSRIKFGDAAALMQGRMFILTEGWTKAAELIDKIGGTSTDLLLVGRKE